MGSKWGITFWFLTGFNFLFGQNAPVTALVYVTGSVSAPVVMPVTVADFNNIGAISLSLDYNYSSIHFVTAVPHPQLLSFVWGENDLGNGYHRISLGWYGSSVTLPDESSILNLTFTYIDGESSLQWFDNGGSCEYADGLANVLNDLPFTDYYHNGFICGEIGTSDPISGPASVCEGQTGIIYSILPVNNSAGYNWSVPQGAIITSGNETSMITVDFPLNSISGNVSVSGYNSCGNGPGTSMQVAVNPMPVANAGNDTIIPFGTSTILYTGTPGTGTYSFHWSPEVLLVDPDVQNPQTINLTSTTVFLVLITDLVSSCQSADDKVVSISGGSLSSSPTANPAVTCQGTPAQLYANAGGGSGNYQYFWTCFPASSPPWTSSIANPVVSPDSSATYHLTVNDGYNAVSGSTFVTVNKLPTLTLSGGDTVCGEGQSTYLIFELTGTPPWNFLYTNAGMVYSVTNLMVSPCSIEITEPGTYVPYSVTDANCNGITFGSAVFILNQIPDPPVIIQNGTKLESNVNQGNHWYLEGSPIQGATEATYFPIITGNYSDIVTVNSCSSDTSNKIYFIYTEIKEVQAERFFISPNPVSRVLKISNLLPDAGLIDIVLLTMEGKVVKEISGFQSAITGELLLDLQGLAPGVYLLQLNTKNDRAVKKLIIR